MQILGLLDMHFDGQQKLKSVYFFSDWLWPYCVTPPNSYRSHNFCSFILFFACLGIFHNLFIQFYQIALLMSYLLTPTSPNLMFLLPTEQKLEVFTYSQIKKQVCIGRLLYNALCIIAIFMLNLLAFLQCIEFENQMHTMNEFHLPSLL